MADLATQLEQELEDAFEVKDRKSLHRYVLLLTDNLVKSDTYHEDIVELKSDVRIVAETMKQGFAQTDRRFEDMNNRFEDMNKRFEDMNKRFEDSGRNIERHFVLMNSRFEDMNLRFGDLSKKTSLGFTVMNIFMGALVLITVLFKFI